MKKWFMNLFDFLAIFLDLYCIFDTIRVLSLLPKNYFVTGYIVTKIGLPIANSLLRGDTPEIFFVGIDASS